jgi:hypothetical protein
MVRAPPKKCCVVLLAILFLCEDRTLSDKDIHQRAMRDEKTSLVNEAFFPVSNTTPCSSISKAYRLNPAVVVFAKLSFSKTDFPPAWHYWSHTDRISVLAVKGTIRGQIRSAWECYTIGIPLQRSGQLLLYYLTILIMVLNFESQFKVQSL